MTAPSPSVPTPTPTPTQMLESSGSPAADTLSNVSSALASSEIQRICLSSATKSGELSTRLTAIESKVREYEIYGSAVMLVLTCAGIGVFTWLKTSSKRSLNKFFDQHAKKALEELIREHKLSFKRETKRLRSELEKEVQTFTQKAEFIARIVGLRSARQYDEVVAILGWDGSIPGLPKESEVVLRALIESYGRSGSRLSRGEKNERMTKAWLAANHIANLNLDRDNLRFILRESVFHRKFKEGISIFESADRSQITPDSEKHVCVLYRNVGQNKRALELAKKYVNDDDLNHANTLASLYADNGDLNTALILLRPRVEAITRTIVKESRGSGWHRVVTTYVGVCNDLREYSAGLTAAAFLVREVADNVSMYISAILCRSAARTSTLPDNLRQAAKQVSGLVADKLDQYPEGLHAVLIRAIIKDAQGTSKDAITDVDHALHEIDSQRDKDGNLTSVAESDFNRCACLKAILMQDHYELCSDEEIETALDHLERASQTDKLGDSAYLSAVFYAKKNMERECIRMLSMAITKRRKWRTIAQLNDVLMSHTSIAKHLLHQTSDALENG